MILSACNDEVLLNNLTQNQANQVLAILQQHNIAAQKSGTLKAGYTITAGHSESTSALSIINEYQLPWNEDVQISQAFPEGALVASPNAEQARVISLQEQRLEQTLRVIFQVVNARVHISYPPFNDDPRGKKIDTHVAVLISYKGELDESIFIPQIKSFIKNSLEDVCYESISVVLFPVPVIQYASPMAVSDQNSLLFISLLVTAVVIILVVGGYAFYRFRLHTQQHPQ